MQRIVWWYNHQVIFMQDDNKENQLENIEATKTSNSEEYDNLIGLFSILLRVDKRVNPHKYVAKEVNHD